MTDREAPKIGPLRISYVECMKCRSARTRLVRVEVSRHEVPPSVEAFVECLECRHQCLITITNEHNETLVARIPLPFGPGEKALYGRVNLEGPTQVPRPVLRVALMLSAPTLQLGRA
jgi:hypothetical protein